MQIDPENFFAKTAMSEVMKNVFISRDFAYAVPSSEDYEVMVEFEKTQRAEALLEHRAYKEMFEEGTLAKKHTFVGDLVDIDEDTIGFAVKAAPIFIFDVVNMVIESPLTVIGNLGKIINFLKPYLLMILPVVPDLLNEDLIKNMLTPHNIEGYYPVLEVINSQN